MRESDGSDPAPRDPEQPSVSPELGPDDDRSRPELGPDDDRSRPELAPDEAFQTLASEVRVGVLVHLLAAERADEDPLSFTELHRTVGTDTSAGFAYHLRQLAGHFVRQTDDGYVLTPAGRRAAEAVVAGTFTDPGERPPAS